MNKTTTLSLQVEDALPILEQYAEIAARYGALLNHVTRRTHNRPGHNDFATARTDWQEKFLHAKRIVESFGVEYEPTSEPETLTVHYDHVGGKQRKTAMGFVVIEGSQPDYKHPRPAYRSGVHTDACKHAAEVVVRRWQETAET